MRFNASVIDNPKSSAYITAILLTLPGSKRYKFCDVICVSVIKVYLIREEMSLTMGRGFSQPRTYLSPFFMRTRKQSDALP